MFPYQFTRFFIILATGLLFACSNSEYVDYSGNGDYVAQDDSSQDINNRVATNTDSTQNPFLIKDYLPLDDTEYPYAGIPRIIIETESFRAIKDRETEIPAKLQIWGELAPESKIFLLTIRGRGNTSWDMPKKSYKIEFVQKQTLLGMPKDRDWALIANYADKTLMKNYLMYHLSAKLNAEYAPRCEFVELYLNKEYLGVYLLTETIKIGKNRINIPQTNESYVIEISQNSKSSDQLIHSHIIKADSIGKTFHVHYPKNASTEILSIVSEDIIAFEKYLKKIRAGIDNDINQRLNIDACIKHYWVEEFSKNPDASSYSSIFFSWTKGSPIKMGPVWDFDLAMGGHRRDSINTPENWHVKKGYWYPYIFRDSHANQARINFWKENRETLVKTINAADSICNLLTKAADNNFKKWDVLQSTSFTYHKQSYNTYKDAVEDLKEWIRKRIEWIDKELRNE